MIKKVIGGDEFIFVNTSGSRSGGFYHSTVLYKNGIEVIKSRANYINRTWESYPFQSVMKSAVYGLIAYEESRLVSDYKLLNGVKRMTKDKKDELYAGSDEIKLYRDLLYSL